MRNLVGIFILILGLGLSQTTAFSANVREYFSSGQKFYEQGNYPKAIESLEKVVEADPNFAEAYNMLGLAHQALGDQGADVAWFYKVATEIDPQYLEAYSNLCRAYYDFHKFDLAQDACQKALIINPEYGQAQLTLAWIYLTGKSDPADALHYFEAVDKKIHIANVCFGMGLAYSMQGDTARSLEMITNLKAMGANDLASQLEADIRKQSQAPTSVAAQNPPPAAQKQAGTVISTSPQQASTPAAGEPQAISGQMTIRLRGQLSGMSSPQGATPKATTTLQTSTSPSKQHPGSLSGD